MTLNFRVVDGNSVDYDTLKEDYLNGIIGDKLCKKHGIGKTQYNTLLKRFKEEGIFIGKKFYGNGVKHPRWYRILKGKNNTYYQVRRMFNKKMYKFGTYKTEEEAIKRVEELEANGWEGLV